MNNMEFEFPLQKRLRRKLPPPLPTDIIFSILKRLSVKSLIRFRCVSKYWNSIISSPSFILNYSFSRPLSYLSVHCLKIPNGKRKLYGTLWDSSFAVVSKDLDISSLFYPFIRWPAVLGSCKGLFCLTGVCNFGRQLLLWNPSIRKRKILPPSSIFPETCDLKLRKERISTFVGVGFDSRTNDFKVLRFMLFSPKRSQSKSGEKVRAEIYSLSLDSWQSVGVPDHLAQNLEAIYTTDHAYIDGAIHWLADLFNEEGEIYSSILRFDFSEERFREIEMPNVYLNGIVHKIVYKQPFVYKGLLALLIYGLEPGNELDLVYYLWTMNESIWTEQRVEFDGMEPYGECIGDRLLSVDYSDGTINMFNPQTLETKPLGIPQPLSIHDFTESLALL